MKAEKQNKTELDHIASSKLLPGCWVLEFRVLFCYIQILLFFSTSYPQINQRN